MDYVSSNLGISVTHGSRYDDAKGQGVAKNRDGGDYAAFMFNYAATRQHQAIYREIKLEFFHEDVDLAVSSYAISEETMKLGINSMIPGKIEIKTTNIYECQGRRYQVPLRGSQKI